MSGMAYLNGDFLPLSEAKISVLDRGFLFGDGVYEVIPAYGGELFRLPQHLARLQRSLDGIRLANPHSEAEWTHILQQVVDHSSEPEQNVYLQLTRGVQTRRDHVVSEPMQPTVFSMSNPILPLSPEVINNGIKAVTMDDIRWQYCHLKTTALLPNVLLKQHAHEAGAAEALLVKGGFVTEGSASNFFIVEQGVIITPPKSAKLLPGVTRDLVLELAAEHGLPHREAEVPLQQLQSADEIWLTSSTREVVPVTQLDGQPVGSGLPGEVWKTLRDCYQIFKRQQCRLQEGQS
ncbi:MAG: D-amino acid aminotransferase [Gammaproteobacteria bacterium]|nr:D-amino acid aminotransferase [Gammaproteobacteria bacterium]